MSKAGAIYDGGAKNIIESANGQGFKLGPYLEKVDVPQPYDFNFVNAVPNSGDSLSGSSSRLFDYFVAFAVNSAIGAFPAAAQLYGPGIGCVTVPGPNGSTVVYSGRFDLTGYYGPNGPGRLSEVALDIYLLNRIGIPGGGPLPGEGFHPVP